MILPQVLHAVLFRCKMILIFTLAPQESDSGVEQDLKRKSLTSPQNRFPNKRLKSQQISPCIIPYGNSIPGQETSGNEDSVTESDSEDELLASKPCMYF